MDTTKLVVLMICTLPLQSHEELLMGDKTENIIYYFETL